MEIPELLGIAVLVIVTVVIVIIIVRILKKTAKIVALRFEISGKEVTQSNWDKFGPDVTEDRLDRIAEAIYNAIGDMKCFEHHKKPSILCSGNTLFDIQFVVTACCDSFKNSVEKKLYIVHSRLKKLISGNIEE